MRTWKKIQFIFTKKQKVKIVIISIMICIGAMFELLGVTAILPFVNVYALLVKWSRRRPLTAESGVRLP